jgi:DNA/RNA endonuclease YhcR with UshA esterase domain
MIGKKTKTLRILAIIAIAMAILVFFFIKFYIFRKSDVSVASKKADIEIAAGDLVKSFESDEKAADAKYLSKIILVKGIVNNVADTETGTAPDITVYLKEKGSDSGVMCSFDKSTFKKEMVKQGDLVSIKGICNGYLMDVVMNKCALVK